MLKKTSYTEQRKISGDTFVCKKCIICTMLVEDLARRHSRRFTSWCFPEEEKEE